MKILWEDGNVSLSMSYLGTLPFLHVEIKEFSKDRYKKYLVEFIKVLKENNLTQVYSSCTSLKSRKLNELFGFKYLCTTGERDIMEYTNDWC